MSTLFLIPARKGSKGLANKNIKSLRGKALIGYSIEFALENAKESDVICISTDDPRVIEIAETLYDLTVPFIRPDFLSSDNASIFDVVYHALNYFIEQGLIFKKLLLLQPTSPIRIKYDFEQIEQIFEQQSADMVVSVKRSKESPYFTLFEEDIEGRLKRVCSDDVYLNRQDCPPVYAYNGSMYLVDVDKFLLSRNFFFKNIIKYEMPDSRSVDIDTEVDWVLAEFYTEKHNENS